MVQGGGGIRKSPSDNSLSVLYTRILGSKPLPLLLNDFHDGVVVEPFRSMVFS